MQTTLYLLDGIILLFAFFQWRRIKHYGQISEHLIGLASPQANFLAESHQYWLDGDESRKDSSMRKFMLGSTEYEYPNIKLPLADDYAEKWSLLSNS